MESFAPRGGEGVRWREGRDEKTGAAGGEGSRVSVAIRSGTEGGVVWMGEPIDRREGAGAVGLLAMAKGMRL